MTTRPSALAVAAALLSGAAAQAPAAEPAPIIEEIIVTAQKREQRLQETPVSVTAFTGETIERLGLRQSVDITAQTPNFNVGFPNGDNGVPAAFIRGVGLNDFGVLNQGPIAAYVDEVYISSNAAQIFQLLDVERVEVLRGPQGTLYGRNATGGAVNYVSRKPTEEWSGWARASYGRFDTTKLEGAIGGPLGENFGIRAALVKTDSDGWLENVLTGNDQQGVDELAWRVLLEATPSDDLSLLLNVRGGKTESDSVQYRHLGVWDAAGDPCPLADIRAGNCVDILGYSEPSAGVGAYDEGSFDFESRNDTDFWGVSLTAVWELNDLVITSITAFDDIEDFRPEETDASPNDLLTGVLGVEQETFSQELRVSQQREGWNWLAGAYYLDDRADDQTSFDILRLLRPLFVGDDVNCSAPPGNPTGFCPEAFVFEQQSATRQDITSFSLYGDASFELTDALTLSVGLRYTDEEVEHEALFFFAEPVADNPVFPGFPTDEKTDFDNVSGRAVLDWKLNDDVLLYGGISTGFKGGGIQSTTDGVFPYDEEELVSYEAGFKSTFSAGRVRLNGSAFFYDYEDLQVFTFVIVGGLPFSLLTNASDAEIYGAELELQWLPAANLFVNLGLGLLDTEYKDFQNALEGDLSGNKVTLAPDVSLNGLVQYDVPLRGAGKLTFQADFTFQDDVFFDSLNNELLSEDSYWLWNGRIGWTSPDERWDVSLWGRNLGDEKYLTYAFDLSFFGFHEQMLGTPRTYGIEVTYRN